MKLSDAQLIDLLGGSGRVAKLCNVTMPSVTHWRTRSIPHGQLLFLAATLEKESHGLITRKDLFPTNWHLVWPELANTSQT
jgi:hypothetical protein